MSDKHCRKHCKLCHDNPKPIELVPGWTIYPACVRCGRKPINEMELSPEEFGKLLADRHADVIRKVVNQVLR